SMQAMHGRLSEPIHYQALQHFVTHSPWPDKPLWDRLSAVIPERRGILALDDTGLPKQGRHSVGVKRQYSGTLGKTGNCEVAGSSLLLDTAWSALACGTPSRSAPISRYAGRERDGRGPWRCSRSRSRPGSGDASVGDAAPKPPWPPALSPCASVRRRVAASVGCCANAR